MFTQADKAQFQKKGISINAVERQINNFENGFEYCNLIRPAVVNDGITQLTDNQLLEYQSLFNSKKEQCEILKFVPASGAATRMFKGLFEFLKNKIETNEIVAFFNNLKDFAFYSKLSNTNNAYDAINNLLNEPGYGQAPKGLIPFHSYSEGARTPFEEHLVEATDYATVNGEASLHFTISEQYRENFNKLANTLKDDYLDKKGIKFKITFSSQQSSTDTIAVNANNLPFRNSDGTILFRPAGHGAILQNLANIDAELIFIKNIDNVLPDHLKGETIDFKQALAGMLLEKKVLAHSILKEIDEGTATPEDIESKAKKLSIQITEPYHTFSKADKINYWYNSINKPIRICGMVKNEGEPGGGPFWVKNNKGEESLQIVESAQINHSDTLQQAIVDQATHFNPVDLVCWIYDYKGIKFDLLKYTDPATGFITEKSKDGKILKAQELPGLWNGAMANWITIFVEVPLSTFSPVKVVNDLLNPQHQPE